MPSTTRRVFMLQLAAAGTAIGAVQAAQAAEKVDEKSPQAVALGYVSDTTKVDPKKYPQHTAAMKCSVCQLYAGKAGDANGPCPIFANNLVSANGWCSSFIKKA